MPPKVEAAQENITHIVRGLSFLAILWVVNTTNTTATNLSVLTNDVKHLKQDYDELIVKMDDRFTGEDGEKLEVQLHDLDGEFHKHKDKDKH